MRNETAALPGLYIHIPFCLSKCPYCDFYSVERIARIPAFLDALRREIALYRDEREPFDTVYMGGGTPSVLSHADLEDLVDGIRKGFTVTPDAEITIEANPSDITPRLLKSLRRAGVNRLNIGVQSLEDRLLHFLGRRHDRNRALAAVGAARAAGFERVGIDLIFGIPGQTLRSWLDSLRETADLNPDHLSCYQLTLEAGTPLGERLRKGEFRTIDESLQADFFLETAASLEAAGYTHYEVSNFARDRCESKHNAKYWNHTPYLGLGPAAHSFRGTERRWNHRCLESYIRDLEAGRPPVAGGERLTGAQLRLESLLFGFRTRKGIDLDAFNRRHGVDLHAEKQGLLDEWAREGLVEIHDGCLRPTRTGMAVADRLALI